MDDKKVSLRYSDEELLEFKEIVEQKLEKAKKELDTLTREIFDFNENEENYTKSIDDSNLASEREYLNTMAQRQEKFIRDLENALLRIKHKTYGICSVTGELIDKRRLLAVPHTTKSMQAKSKS
jgi:RNA polymerase-binding transcription factor DksA